MKTSPQCEHQFQFFVSYDVCQQLYIMIMQAAQNIHVNNCNFIVTELSTRIELLLFASKDTMEC